MARPEKLTDDQKLFIAELKQNNPAITTREVIGAVKNYLINKMKEASPHFTAQELEKIVVDEQLSKTAIIKYLTEVNVNLSVIIDTPWNTAALDTEPITTEALPWLILTQENRKLWLSKMLTQREAKWFNRFFGFKSLFSSQALNDLGIVAPDANLINTYQAAIVATWAQIYGQREKAATVAGIEKPDFSDLDSYLACYDTDNLARAEVKRFWDDVQLILARIESGIIPDRKRKIEIENRIESGVLSFIRSEEMLYLNHSLGTPDMSLELILLYFQTMVPDYVADRFRELTYHPLNEPELSIYYAVLPDSVIEMRNNLTYIQRVNYLVSLRQWCKEHPEALKVRPENFEVEMLSLINDIKMEGKTR